MGIANEYYCTECKRTDERMALVAGCPLIPTYRCPMRGKSEKQDTDWISKPPENANQQMDPTNPAHYKQGGIECIDAIEAALTPEEFRGFCKGNVIKYTWRERIKGKNESLAKARWYINRLVGDEPCT